MLIKLFN